MFIQVIYEDQEQDWTQNWSLRNTCTGHKQASMLNSDIYKHSNTFCFRLFSNAFIQLIYVKTVQFIETLSLQV